jgi:thiol-disulfide isomerase/thioredoxin
MIISIFNKSIFLSLFLSLLVIGNLSAEEYDMAEDGENRAVKAAGNLVGQLAPILNLKTINDQKIDLSKSLGKKPIYLKFWATWCVPCNEQMAKFKKIYSELGDKMTIIAVNTGFNDNAKSAKKYVKKKKLPMPVVIDDGTLAGVFKLKVTPMHVVIGRDGKIAHIGHKDGEKLDKALKGVIDQKVNPKLKFENAPKKKQLAIGSQVKELNFNTLDSKKIVLKKGSKNIRALMFLAPWCETYLLESRPEMARSCKKVRLEVEPLLSNKKIEWYGVSSNLWVNKKEVFY